jgi:hypothetical protein
MVIILVSNNKLGHRKFSIIAQRFPGIIAANRNNDFGINGISEMSKLIAYFLTLAMNMIRILQWQFIMQLIMERHQYVL